jgi:hypothetical protein
LSSARDGTIAPPNSPVRTTVGNGVIRIQSLQSLLGL